MSSQSSPGHRFQLSESVQKLIKARTSQHQRKKDKEDKEEEEEEEEVRPSSPTGSRGSSIRNDLTGPR